MMDPALKQVLAWLFVALAGNMMGNWVYYRLRDRFLIMHQMHTRVRCARIVVKRCKQQGEARLGADIAMEIAGLGWDRVRLPEDDQENAPPGPPPGPPINGTT